MTNASTWFYSQPEPVPFLIAERVNNTFWAARVVDIYWTVTRAEAPYRAEGLLENAPVELEWVPGEWLALGGPQETPAFKDIINAISARIVARPATLTYINRRGMRVYEWHPFGGKERWREIQGKPEFIAPERLK